MALKKGIGDAFNQVLESAGARKPVEDKPFWRSDEKDDDTDDKSKTDEDEDTDEPSSFADLIKKKRLDGSLDGTKEDDDEEEPVKPKSKKKKAKKPEPEDTDDDDIAFKLPKKKNEDKKEEVKDDEEEADDKDEVKKEDEKEDDKKDEDELEEGDQKLLDDALAIDPATLTNKNGQPIVGEQASKAIKRLKQTIKHFAERVKKERKKPDYDPQLPNHFKNLSLELNALKSKYEAKYFEETPEWKNKYEKPLDDAATEAAKWIRAHDLDADSEELQEVERHRNLMQKALKEGDDVKYYQHADSIADYLQKGAAGRFQNAVPKLWDAYHARQEALKDKEAAKKVVTEEAEGFLSSNIKSASTNLDVMVNNFEETNSKIISVYKTKPGIKDAIDYENTVTKRLDSTKKLIDQALRNRTIPAELQQIIFSGILSGLRDKEMDGLREAYKQTKEEVARLEAQLAKKDATLSKVKPNRAIIDDDDDDDEEDDDTPDFATFFKKKINGR